ncbi:phage tail protein [Pararhizobium antarcticum]|uniref:Tip attachment protein J domain-containing protein n=1 Tax=Pararhizobium antarcticum TaxID=1798805 RepID=A0A657LUG3_9HYPH|nr:phage tail protein [Pararhizobium antarcticum]OJF97565.1 hypothetical protein AX760_16510 [Pararhizobium antarcticum]
MALFTSIGVASALGLASASFFTTVSAIALNAAVGIGISLAAQALSGRGDAQSQAGGVRGTIQAGGDVARSIILGRRATSGSLAYVNTWGNGGKTPNAYLVQVIQLADAPIRSLDGILVNGEPCEIDWENENPNGVGFPVVEYAINGTDYLWVKFYDGSQTAADAYLVNKFSSHPIRPYGATRIGKGLPYVVMTARVNPELFSGFPAFRFEVTGSKLYDPSKDTSVGGSGSQRWATPSTWGGDGDHLPAVQIYNILRGIRYSGSWLYGLQNLPAGRLPASHWIAQINKCRAAIGGPDGDEPRYLTGVEIPVDTEFGTSIETLLTGCNGKLSETGGTYKLRVGDPEAAVFSFSDGDVLSTEDQSYVPFFGLSETVNGISASYPEPKEGWNTKTAPPLFNANFEVQDGGRRLMSDVPMNAVYRSSQVQRIMKEALAEARRARRQTIVLGPSAQVLEPGDIVEETSTRNGFETKLFRVDGVADRSNLDVMLDITEVDPADYAWNQFTDYKPPVYQPLDRVYPDATVVDGWQVEPATLKDAAGIDRRPSIKVLAADAVDDVKNVWVQVRLVSSGALVFDSTSIPYAPPYEWILNGTFLPATNYQARGQEVPYSNRKTEWSAWLDVTTPDVRIAIDDLKQEIIDRLDVLKDWIDADLFLDFTQAILDIEANADAIEAEQTERVDGAIETAQRYRALLNEIDAIRDYVANADYAGYTAREELRRVVTVRLEESIALFDERITVAVSKTAAISERLTTFAAEVDGVRADITLVDTARVDGDEALAQQIALITVGTDNQFDPFKLWNFDASVESWSGNGVPTVSGGFLRPANAAIDPYVISPPALAIAANTYRQVRARIRKYGSPTWDGQLWWYLAADPTWDVSRQVTIAEPSYDANSIALLTFNVDWTGTIDRIRIDLSAAQTATDYFTIDWIAIGSPSPGASRAELAAEQSARITADSANVADIVAIEASINDPETGLTAIAGGVSALASDVTVLEGTVTALSTAVTSVDAELDGKASTTALAVLSAEVAAIGGGGVVAQGQSVTAVRNALLPIALEAVDQDFANLLGKMQGLKVTADASQVLTTRIELTERSLDVVSRAVSVVQAVIPNLATASALSSLESRAVVNEGLTAAQAEAITRVKADLGWVDGNAQGARAVALTDLQASVTLSYNLADAKSKVYRQTSAPAGTTAVPLRTNDLWIDSDDGNKTYRWTGSAWSDVTDTRITSNASAITSIKAELDWDEDAPSGGRATAFTALDTRVDSVIVLADSKNKVFRQTTAPTGSTAFPLRTNDIWYDSDDGNKPFRWTGSAWSDVTDTRITASASAITEIQATVDGNSADARFKMEVVAGPSGYARIGGRVRYGTSGSYRAAGFYVDVPSGTAVPTLFVVEADQFAFKDGSSLKVPFRIASGIVYIDDLRVGTSNITPNAVTATASMSGNSLGDPEDTVALTSMMSGSPAMISITGSYSISAGSSFSGTFEVSVVNTTTGSTAYSFFRSYGSGNTSGTLDAFRIHSATNAGTNNYKLVIERSGFGSVSVDIDVKFLYWRR